jgi:hypothetical protein
MGFDVTWWLLACFTCFVAGTITGCVVSVAMWAKGTEAEE